MRRSCSQSHHFRFTQSHNYVLESHHHARDFGAAAAVDGTRHFRLFQSVQAGGNAESAAAAPRFTDRTQDRSAQWLRISTTRDAKNGPSGDEKRTTGGSFYRRRKTSDKPTLSDILCFRHDVRFNAELLAQTARMIYAVPHGFVCRRTSDAAALATQATGLGLAARA